MTAIQLHIPCLVQQQQLEEGQAMYYLRPLFQMYPMASHARFDQALETLRREIRSQLDQWQIDRQQVDDLLWYAFDPDIESHKFNLDITLNKRTWQGSFSLFTFQLKNLHFGYIPGFDNHFFLTDPESDLNLRAQFQQQVEYLLRDIHRKDPAEFNFENYVIPKREFITSLELELNVKNQDFKFDRSKQNSLAMLFGGQTSFEGTLEIYKVAENLNFRYPQNLSRAYYREELVERYQDLMFGKHAAPVALVGPEGSGRHSILEEGLYRYLKTRPGNGGHERKCWLMDPNQVIAGMSVVGWWEQRFESILNYIRKAGPEPDLLVVDNPLALLRIGRSAQSSLNLASLLKPYLEKRQIPVTLIASTGQWKLLQEQDPALARQFQLIRVEPAEQELAVRISLKKRRWLEKKYNCHITIPAIQELFKLHRNFFHERALPGSVIRQLEQLVSREPFGYIDIPQVREAFSNLSGWKDQIFNENSRLQQDEIEEIIGSQLVGQKEAVDALGGAIHLVKARLNNPGKPYSSFLFVGPTGVGKTQAAKVLCRTLTGSEKALVRFDMNEYLDGGAAQRLIGSFAQPEGHLTSRVRLQPFCVLLFDEVEKAHPAVVDLLLQVLDDGRLTDSRGRKVDFTNTFIILTSNLGSREAESRLGFRTESWDERDAYQKALSKHFRPEFINRIDETVVFSPLTEKEILGIARLQIRELLSRDGFVRRTTLLNISAKALEWVARRGYDPKMGGRALKRQIERDLTRLSAEQLIRIPSEHPILLTIDLLENKLKPKITSLEFVKPNPKSWQPEMPHELKGGRFYRQLLQRLESLEQKVRDMDELPGTSMLDISQATENWEYYHFQNSIAEQKERIQTLLLGHRDPNFRDSPIQAYRFRSGALPTDAGKDFFRADQLSEFREHYRLGQQHFNSQQSEFMSQYIEVRQLELSGYHFLNEQADQLSLIVEPCIQHADEAPLKYLFDQYAAWFKDREIPHDAHHGSRIIKAEDFGLYDQLRGELGLHFFYGPVGSPIPVRVKIDRPGAKQGPDNTEKIIRIYDRGNTLIDIRSGFANEFHASPQEWNLLVFAGWTDEIRNLKP